MSNKDIRDTSLLEYLPDSIADDPEIIAMTRALDVEMQDVSEHIIDAIIWPRLQDQPEEILNELAWSMNFQQLRAWDLADGDSKRAFLRHVFFLRKRAGTLYAVRRCFDLLGLGLTGEVVEWFQEGAPPFTFRLRIFAHGDVGVTRDQLIAFKELVRRFQRVAAKCREYAVERQMPTPLAVIPIVTAGINIEIPFGGL